MVNNTVSDVINSIYLDNPSCRNLIKSEVYRKIASAILPICDGDVLEIGAYEGDTTSIFLEEAKKLKKS